MDIEDLKSKIHSVSYLKHRDFMDEYPKDKIDSFFMKLIDNLENINSKKEFSSTTSKIEKELKINKKIRQSHLNYFLRKLYCENNISTENFNKIKEYIVTKKMRSQSGILEVAIMTSPGNFSCAYNCYYCPDQPDMPRSYIKEEPAVRRAAANNFDTVEQFYDRATTYSLNGHPVDKIELIILGGTWSSYPVEYQKEFIRDLYFAANTFYSSPEEKKRKRLTIKEEQNINTKSLCHIIGLTLETRPDSINIYEIKRFNYYGVTRVQLGVQHTDNKILKKINRQSTVEDSINAIKILKDCGFKIMIHIMPNLPYSSPEKDIEMFDQIIDSDKLQADEWKIYPTSVTTTSDKDNEPVNTVIEKWFQDGKYIPYDHEDLMEVILHAKRKIPHWIRIGRIFRDIPLPNIIGGADVPHMRQVLAKRLEEKGEICECIRCREVKSKKFNTDDLYYRTLRYKASGNDEFFISCESLDSNLNRLLHGFLRLRLSSDPGLNKEFSESKDGIIELENCALIRELHVYGKLLPVFSNNTGNNQHKGIGKKMLKIAEKISLQNGYFKISVISGIGVRDYYRKYGYELNGSYMIKKLVPKIPLWEKIFLGTILFITLNLIIGYCSKLL